MFGQILLFYGSGFILYIFISTTLLGYNWNIVIIGFFIFDFAVVNAKGCIIVFVFVPYILNGPKTFILKVRSVIVLFVNDINFICSGSS